MLERFFKTKLQGNKTLYSSDVWPLVDLDALRQTMAQLPFKFISSSSVNKIIGLKQTWLRTYQPTDTYLAYRVIFEPGPDFHGDVRIRVLHEYQLTFSYVGITAQRNE
jgi:hypothetical protein